MNRVQFLNGFLIEHVHVYQTLYLDLDVIQKMDAIFDDYRIFVKITEKLRNAKELLRKDAEDFDWENL